MVSKLQPRGRDWELDWTRPEEKSSRAWEGLNLWRFGQYSVAKWHKETDFWWGFIEVAEEA